MHNINSQTLLKKNNMSFYQKIKRTWKNRSDDSTVWLQRICHCRRRAEKRSAILFPVTVTKRVRDFQFPVPDKTTRVVDWRNGGQRRLSTNRLVANRSWEQPVRRIVHCNTDRPLPINSGLYMSCFTTARRDRRTLCNKSSSLSVNDDCELLNHWIDFISYSLWIQAYMYLSFVLLCVNVSWKIPH